MSDSYNATIGFKVFDRTGQNSEVNQLISLLHDPEIQSFLKVFVDNAIATSELRILKRLAAIEQKLGIIDYGLDEPPTIESRLTKLEQKVNTHTNEFKPAVEPQIKPVTKTEKRAVALVSKLRQVKKRFLTSAEIVSFLKQLPEDIQITEDMRNPREIKREVLEKATQLFPDIQLNKSKHGRREVRILVS